MGFFDLLNPLFDGIDSGLQQVLPATARLAFWALVGGFLSMFSYRLVSRQDAMAELKPRIAQAQKALANFDGELNEIWPLLRCSLSLSMKQFGLAFGPALVASIPLIFQLVWLSNRYDLIEAQPGDTIDIHVLGDPASVWHPDTAAQREDDGRWRLKWPAANQSIRLRSSDRDVLTLPLPAFSPVVHKHQWWNVLIGNPAGYLDDDATIEAVELDFRSHEYLGFGPDWLRSWEFLFISLLFTSSIAIKVIFKIH